MEARAHDGRTIASFVNFGCHPETLGDRAKLLSADFPGPLRSRIEEQRGGTAIFANGALGGMITTDVGSAASLPERLAFVERMGRMLSDAAIAAIERAERADVRSIRWASRTVELAGENELFETLERIGLIEPHQRGTKGGILTEVARVDLGPAAWAIVPGEPSPRIGLRIKEVLSARGASHPAVIALGNDELGYILDPSEYDDPKFAYEVSVSVGRETAPAIEAALRAIGGT
jgi:hypothetical protein